MITITRTDYAFATVDASACEWDAIKAIVRFCAGHFSDTQLRYSLPGPEEQRHSTVDSLSETLDEVWGLPPIELVHKNDVFLIASCIRDTAGRKLPDIDHELHEHLARQLADLDVYGIFDDDHVSSEQWTSWNIERSIHSTKQWIMKLHAGQTDKAGQPYAQHPLRVHMLLQKLFPEAGEDVRHAALLHDVLEDCDVTTDDLRERGYSESTIQIVEVVTKRPDDGLTYKQRIERLAQSGPVGAIQVKLCDLLDNTDPERLRALPVEKAKSLSKRYSIAIDILRSRLACS
jgi:hypothetical protein